MRRLLSGALLAATLLAFSSTAAAGAVPVLRVRPALDAASTESVRPAAAKGEAGYAADCRTAGVANPCCSSHRRPDCGS